MGAPITAPEYKEIHGVVWISRTCKGQHREVRINQGGTTKRNALVLIVFTIKDGSFFLAALYFFIAGKGGDYE